MCDSAASGDVLDLWADDALTAADNMAGGVSFDVSMAAPVPVLWQVNLPEDLALAAARLGESEDSLLRSQEVLTTAADRLHQMQPTNPAAALSFGIESEAPRPESELLALFQAAPQAVSFGVRDDLAAPEMGWEQAQQVFQSLMDKLRQSVADCLLVETRIAGRLLAHTSVNWSGDVQTVWPGGKSLDEVMLHQRTVALALKSRETMLKMFAASVQMAISLSLRLSLPGGPLLALPAVLRFIKQMLELQKNRQPLPEKELWQTN